MSLSLTVNSVVFDYPVNGERNWGSDASGWAAAVTSGMLQKAGGSFALTAEVDFGGTFGLKSLYFKSRTSNPASAGAARLARADVVSWRNQANSGDLDLGVDSSDRLTFGGVPLTGSGAIVNADISGSAAIAYSKLNLAGALVNADVSSSAAIAYSKLAALTADRLLVSSGAGAVSASAVTATEAGYLAGASSNLQTQISARLPLAGGTMTGAVLLSGAPTLASHAATKQYVDDVLFGVMSRFAVRAATTASVNLSNALENGDSLDGLTLATGDRVLVKNQASPAQNGIYVVPASGAASRATDADTWTELVGASVFVSSGTANSGTSWQSTASDGGTLGTDPVSFVQTGGATSYAADGQGVELSGTTFSLELADSTLSKSGSGLAVASGGLTNTHINSSAAIAYSKLALTGSIVNSDVSGSAAIAISKLGVLTTGRVLQTNASTGAIEVSSTTLTTLGYLDATSSIQTQLDDKLSKASGGTVSGATTFSSTSGTTVKVPVSTPVDNGNGGSSKLIDWTAGANQKLTLNSATCTVTFTAPPAGALMRLLIVQDGTGGRSISWPTVKWAGGSAPVLSTAAGKRDIVSLYYDGADYYGTATLNWA